MPVWVRRRKGIWFDHIHLSLSTVHTWNKVVDRENWTKMTSRKVKTYAFGHLRWTVWSVTKALCKEREFNSFPFGQAVASMY